MTKQEYALLFQKLAPLFDLMRRTATPPSSLLTFGQLRPYPLSLASAPTTDY